MHGNAELRAQCFQRHAIQHDLFIALQRRAWNDQEVAANTFASLNKISAGQKTRDRHITAEVMILHRGNLQHRAKAIVQFPNLLFQLRSEESSSHDRAVNFPGTLWRLAFEPLHQRAELIAKRAHHANAIFDLWILAVVLSPGHVPSCPQINLITEKSERRAHLTTQLILNQSHFLNRPPAELGCDRCQTLVGVVAGQTEGNDGDAANPRIISGEIEYGATKNLAIIDAGTQHHLRVYFYIRVHQTRQLVGNISPTLFDAQKVSANIQISGMDRHVLRRQSLLD